MPSDPTKYVPLPLLVRLLRCTCGDADTACARVAGDSAATAEARKAALAARREASENYPIWRDVLKEMD